MADSLIYHLTGPALATGFVIIVSTLPGVLFGSPAGVVVDRVDRRRVMLLVTAALFDVAAGVTVMLLLRTRRSVEPAGDGKAAQ